MRTVDYIRLALTVMLLSGVAAAQDAGRQAPRAWLRYVEAQRLKAEGQARRDTRLIDQAILALRETIELDPAAADPHIDLGELYFLFLSRPEEATREAEAAVRLEPEGMGGHQLLARIAVARTREDGADRAVLIPKAILALEKVVRLDPRHAEGWALLSDLLQAMGAEDRQLDALEKWAASPPAADEMFYRWMTNSDLSTEQAFYRLSTIYLRRGRTAEALSAARRAYDGNPDEEEYGSNLVSVLSEALSLDEELQAYDQLMSGTPAGVMLLGYGSALVRAGRDAEAIEVLREYVEADPENIRARGLLAVALRRSGQRAAAVEVLKTAIAAGDRESRRELQLELGETYEEMGLDAEAIGQYDRVFEWFLAPGRLTPPVTPLFNEVVGRLARLLRRVGNQSGLQTRLNRTRKVIDDHNPLLDLLAIEALREDGRRREALSQTRAAARRFPGLRELLFSEATLLAETGSFSESVELLEAALVGAVETATEDAAIHQSLASVHLHSGDTARAEESVRRALALNPGDEAIRLQHASVLQRRRRFDEAERLLREMLVRDPANATILNNLGFLLVESGTRYDEARTLIERALAIEPTNGSFLDSLAWADFRLGRSAKAREILEKALVYARRNPIIHEHLGDVLASLGKSADARRQWEIALECAVNAGDVSRLRRKLAGQ